MVKKILSILVWVITAGGIITLFIFSRMNYLSTPLKSISISIEGATGHEFVNKDTLLCEISSICHIDSKNSIGNINMLQIERHLNNNPWIEKSTAYIGLDSILYINLKEYEPVLRVFNKSGKSMYVTEQGVVFPTSKTYTPRILVASGNFDFPTDTKMNDSIYQSSGIGDALHIRQAIQKDEFIQSCIGQIFRNNAGEYEIAVNEVNARVILGDTCQIDDKLLKMKTFLKHKLGSEELHNYSIVNLKFKNQIVCTKK